MSLFDSVYGQSHWIFFISSPQGKSNIIGLDSVTVNTAGQVVIDDLNPDRVTAWIQKTGEWKESCLH